MFLTCLYSLFVYLLVLLKRGAQLDLIAGHIGFPKYIGGPYSTIDKFQIYLGRDRLGYPSGNGTEKVNKHI